MLTEILIPYPPFGCKICRNVIDWISTCGNRTWRRLVAGRVYWVISAVWMGRGLLISDRYCRKCRYPIWSVISKFEVLFKNLKCYLKIWSVISKFELLSQNLKCYLKICLERARETASNCRLGCRNPRAGIFRQKSRMLAATSVCFCAFVSCLAVFMFLCCCLIFIIIIWHFSPPYSLRFSDFCFS
jgi:hypothetical protein